MKAHVLQKDMCATRLLFSSTDKQQNKVLPTFARIAAQQFEGFSYVIKIRKHKLNVNLKTQKASTTFSYTLHIFKSIIIFLIYKKPGVFLKGIWVALSSAWLSS